MRRFIEYLFWFAGFVALGYCAFLWGRAEFDQAMGRWVLGHSHEQPTISLPRSGRQTSPPQKPEGSLVGRIEIPRLRLSAIVFEGTSEGTLTRGVGHLTGTAASPDEAGNFVLAAHRDTFFRNLRGVRAGDTITVTAPGGEFDYLVEKTRIVNPDAVEVLRPQGRPTLTLITCYPFTYVGTAPQRFVVVARKVKENKIAISKDERRSSS